MKSIIYSLAKLRRLANFTCPLNEIGIMVDHCGPGKIFTLDRYFFCFSFNMNKYNSDSERTVPQFSILPPGTTVGNNGNGIRHDELFFSYSAEHNESIRRFFPALNGRGYRSSFQTDNEFNYNLLKIKELLEERTNIGIADKLDVLAMQMIINVYAACSRNDAEANAAPDAKIQEIAIKLKHGEKINTLLRKYGYSRRAFYYEWNKNFSVSPKHIQLEAKLGKAQNLLLSTKLPIVEIAALCGFSSHRYFHESFIKYFNSTPGNYRKRFQLH